MMWRSGVVRESLGPDAIAVLEAVVGRRVEAGKEASPAMVGDGQDDVMNASARHGVCAVEAGRVSHAEAFGARPSFGRQRRSFAIGRTRC